MVELCGLDRGSKVTGAHHTTREVLRILLYSAAAAILDLNVRKPVTVWRSERVVEEDSRVGRLLAIQLLRDHELLLVTLLSLVAVRLDRGAGGPVLRLID